MLDFSKKDYLMCRGIRSTTVKDANILVDTFWYREYQSFLISKLKYQLIEPFIPLCDYIIRGLSR